MKVCLLDAGPLVALFNPQDRFHAHFRQGILESAVPMRLHTTWPCITEASHLLGPRHRVALLQWVGAGAVQVYPFDSSDLLDMCGWILQYTQQPRSEMDLADASLYWLACETGVAQIFTVDMRDFGRYRLPDGRSFEIL
ncbi:MAG: VapC toxin family PIN domain ribonuclease [Proteobacteria bacterium]|nr:VapC toxin family PIN domain ribonuclease [Pseudomonadota bacterium]